jgi:hypothetical protein
VTFCVNSLGAPVNCWQQKKKFRNEYAKQDIVPFWITRPSHCRDENILAIGKTEKATTGDDIDANKFRTEFDDSLALELLNK